TTGDCSGGVCSYDYLDYDCADDGEICVAGACVAADPCAGVTCDEPPADSCAGTVARVYDTTGDCSGGVCSYDYLDYDCADDGEICVAGACVDPCAGVTCDTPPADGCSGTVARLYDTTGTCSGGVCDYTFLDYDCADDGDICVAGACVDPCDGVTCDTPPAPECAGDSVRTYNATGTCTGGVCDYGFSDYDCTTEGKVCDAGACVAVTNCGNGVIDAGEVCDGGQLNSKTCGDLGWPAGTLACATDCLSYDVSACTNVFISEYIEGSGNNKAVELYNASGHEIDLSSCTLRTSFNGGSSSQSYTPSGVLAAGATFTVCNGGSVAGLLDNCDATSAVTGFNGDDALELTCDGVVVDIFGQIGVDPGSAWTGGGVTTQERTLRRKCSITQGNTAGGAFDPSVEWDSFAQDTFDGVGAHCPGSLTIGWCKVQWPIPSFTLDATAVDIFGRVYIAGQTELTQHLYDPHAKVLAQWGFGLSTDVAGFSWVRAVGNDTGDSNNNDEYKASISKALTAGTYRYAYRFSADGGATWAYCDTDDTFAFDPSLAGTMTVTP
ncbi:MAG: lamin tail domain-containing protein, partial [Myxococcota bacterium]|nr:lamin tail domain-containing protein [Myxococcota bacterium]